MSVTNYYAAEGQLLGEQASGQSRRDYLADALGSVVGTATSSAAAENAYRYKPYGTLLSRSGAAADPAFQWVGSLGYRQTGRKHSDVYVRARHYGTAAGRWTTKDPAKSSASTSPYDYPRPVISTDPDGLQPTSPCASDNPPPPLPGPDGVCPQASVLSCPAQCQDLYDTPYLGGCYVYEIAMLGCFLTNKFCCNCGVSCKSRTGGYSSYQLALSAMERLVKAQGYTIALNGVKKDPATNCVTSGRNQQSYGTHYQWQCFKNGVPARLTVATIQCCSCFDHATDDITQPKMSCLVKGCHRGV